MPWVPLASVICTHMFLLAWAFAYSVRSRAPLRCDGGRHSAVMAPTAYARAQKSDGPRAMPAGTSCLPTHNGDSAALPGAAQAKSHGPYG